MALQIIFLSEMENSNQSFSDVLKKGSKAWLCRTWKSKTRSKWF